MFYNDTIGGLLTLAASDFPGPVNIGNPTELTVLRVAEIIRDCAHSTSPIHHIPAVEDDPQRRCPDIGTARDQLGWEPKVRAEEGLAQTVSWFRAHAAPPQVAV